MKELFALCGVAAIVLLILNALGLLHIDLPVIDVIPDWFPEVKR